MPNALRLAVAAGLVACLSGAAMALESATSTAANRGAPQRAHTIPYSYEDYGLDGACANRPFAQGCDKRGFW